MLTICFPMAALDARNILNTFQELVHHEILFKTGMSPLSNVPTSQPFYSGFFNNTFDILAFLKIFLSLPIKWNPRKMAYLFSPMLSPLNLDCGLLYRWYVQTLAKLTGKFLLSFYFHSSILNVLFQLPFSFRITILFW